MAVQSHLLGACPPGLDVKHLTTAICPAVGAGMVRLTGAPALLTGNELGNLHFVVRAAVALAPVRDSFFG